MAENDEAAGVFDAIDANETAHKPAEQKQEVSETAKAEGSESTTEAEKKPKEQKQKTEETQETGTTDEGETQQTETSEDAHSKTETTDSKESETKTETAKSEQDFSKWQEQLPPAPAEYEGKKPDFNEDGQITNMNPQEYLDYTIAMAQQATRKENHTVFIEGKALDIAEQIIPDIKSNPSVRKMVENTRIASILSGTPIDTVQAALQVRELLGLAPERIQAAKSEGANSTKASIEIQKNAALETGSAQKKNTSEGEKVTALEKRVKRGDDNAFAELLGIWEDKGLLK